MLKFNRLDKPWVFKTYVVKISECLKPGAQNLIPG